MDIEIETYWNVETLYYVLNAVASLMNGAGFEGLLKLVFLFAFALGIFAYIGNKQIELLAWFFQALIFTSLLNLPIARVTLSDRAGLEPPRVVANVPFALATVAQTTNLTFSFLTRSYESAFGVPDALGLQQGDVGFGHRILKQVNSATIRDPGLRADLMQFIKECTLYDIKDGEITPQQIIGGTDSWNLIFSKTSPARFVTYDTLSATPKTNTCSAVAAILKPRVEDATKAAERFYGKRAFSRTNSDALAANLFVSAVGTSYDWILNNSANASDAMKQAMFNNIWKEARSELPTLLNDSARVAEVTALAGAAQAAQQADGANSTLSLLAQETLPHMRNWIEAIMYALFPVIVLLMIVVSAEGAKKIFAGYMMSLAWIGLWPLLFAVINHLSLMHLRYKARALELAKGVPFQLSDAFDATLAQEQSMIGYMVVVVPFIAAGIIRMGQGGFMSVADRMVSGFSSAGASVGSSLAGGNVSIGQTRLDSAAVNSTSMHKHDNEVGLYGGGAAIGRGDGSVAMMSGNRTVALQQFQNRMLRQMGMDQRSEASRSQEAHRTEIASSGEQRSHRTGESASSSQIHASEMSRGDYQQQSVQAAMSRQGGYGSQHVLGESLDRNHRESSSFQMGAGAADQLGFNLGAGNSTSVGSGSSGTAKIAGSSAPVHAMAGHRPVGRGISGEEKIVRGMTNGGASPEEIEGAVDRYRTESGSGNKEPASNQPKGSTQATRGGLNASFPLLSAGIALRGNKHYTAEHSRNRSVDTAHGEQESVRSDTNYSVSGSHVEQSAHGRQANQSHRSAQDAVHAQVSDFGQVRDASHRDEFGRGERASRNESHSTSRHRDLMADPYLFEKVASRNGMTAMRFANQSQDRMFEMVEDYVAERGMTERAKTMPGSGFSGERLPTSQRDLQRRRSHQTREISNDIDDDHRATLRELANPEIKPIGVDVAPPAMVEQSNKAIDEYRGPTNAGSIRNRTAQLDENVHSWASPDKRLGEGRANPAAVTEDTMIRDGSDTFWKAVDKVKGGDGTADGEALSENKKRDTHSAVKPGDGIGK